MPLTQAAITNTKRHARRTKLFDSGGLYLLVNPDGSRWWRLKYRFEGREKLLSLGIYPATSLKRAREKRDEARRLLADGIDPSATRQAEKAARLDSFESIAREWLALQEMKLAETTAAKARWMLERFVYPHIGSRPIGRLAAPEMLALLRRIEGRGAHETTHRTKQLCGRIFRYAVATGRVHYDPTADLRGALAPVVTQNRAAITDPKRIGELLRAIDGYQGQPATVYALRLAPLLFVRPGELRAAEWSEFDLDEAVWRIPATRMKMGEQHLVPLPRQAVELLRDLYDVTGAGKLVFPSLRSCNRPLSENTLNAALRRLDFAKGEQTAHGFRALASTQLNEMGFAPDVIERQLAHVERNKVRAAYNRAERLAERKVMMQTWADYLDGLRSGATVTPIRRQG